MSTIDISEYENDPRLFLFTSLTSGSSHIITATSRLETILKANKIPFLAIDTATDEKARRLWQRRGQKKKLPGLVKEGYVIGVCASLYCELRQPSTRADMMFSGSGRDRRMERIWRAEGEHWPRASYQCCAVG